MVENSECGPTLDIALHYQSPIHSPLVYLPWGPQVFIIGTLNKLVFHARFPVALT